MELLTQYAVIEGSDSTTDRLCGVNQNRVYESELQSKTNNIGTNRLKFQLWCCQYGQVTLFKHHSCCQSFERTCLSRGCCVCSLVKIRRKQSL